MQAVLTQTLPLVTVTRPRSKSRPRTAKAKANQDVQTRLSRKDKALVEKLLAGDSAAFEGLVRKHHAGMVRLAAMYVRGQATAEDVVQETWMAVLDALPRFEGRSSLTTWVYRILVNRAKTRGTRDRRLVPFSARDPEERGDPDAFGAMHFTSDGRWADAGETPPERNPEIDFSASETLAQLEDEIQKLPRNQREVVTLRDIQGWDAHEVCDLLEIADGHQRVLLHRARKALRKAMFEREDRVAAAA